MCMIIVIIFCEDNDVFWSSEVQSCPLRTLLFFPHCAVFVQSQVIARALQRQRDIYTVLAHQLLDVQLIRKFCKATHWHFILQSSMETKEKQIYFWCKNAFYCVQNLVHNFWFFCPKTSRLFINVEWVLTMIDLQMLCVFGRLVVEGISAQAFIDQVFDYFKLGLIHNLLIM